MRWREKRHAHWGKSENSVLKRGRRLRFCGVEDFMLKCRRMWWKNGVVGEMVEAFDKKWG
jgi:hypothetical protein